MRDLFIKDWGWKLFSLLLAAGIWLTVHRILEPETNLANSLTSKLTYENLPVLVVSSASDVSQYHIEPTVVKVTVSGPPEVMDKLQATRVRAIVDLTDVVATKNFSRPVNISAPPNVTLISVEPPTVSVIPPPKS